MAKESIDQHIESKAKSKSGKAPVIIKKIKKAEGGAHGGSWKVAYADFVTAMMAFFLLMWLLNSLKPETKAQLAVLFQATQEAKTPQQQLPVFVPGETKVGTPEFKLNSDQKIKHEIAMLLKEMVSDDDSMKRNSGVSADDVGVLLQVNSQIMFPQGSATLTPEAEKVLDNVIKIMKMHKINVMIRGHTDDSDEKSPVFPTNWDLSAARAASAVRYLLEKGQIPNTAMMAAGFADSRPLVPNSSPENRAKNRRVEFFFYSPDKQGW